MSVYNSLFTNLILPITDLVLSRRVNQELKFLSESQWWSRHEIENYQNEKLQCLIQHAYTNVPYYNSLFKANNLLPTDIKKKDDLYKIPILSKEAIHKNFPKQLVAQNLQKQKMILKQSSGSTGQQTSIYMSRGAYDLNIAANLRGWEWMGYSLGDKIIKVSQNERHTVLKKIQDKLSRTKLFSQQYTNEDLNRFIDLLLGFNPKFLRIYPDPLLFISKYVLENQTSLPKLNGINTTGNILSHETRNMAEKVFNTKIFDSYSCEGGANVFECPSHTRYHVAEEYGIIEVVDNEGIPVDDNKMGRAVVTDLTNFAMPIIRYDSKDILESTDNSCKCGRRLMGIKSIKGRDNDILVTPKGKYLIAQMFTTYFKHLPYIEQFQIYQQEYDHLIINIVPNLNISQEMLDNIKKYWIHYLDENLNIEVCIQDSIDPLSSGKRRFLIRNEKIKLPV